MHGDGAVEGRTESLARRQPNGGVPEFTNQALKPLIRDMRQAQSRLDLRDDSIELSDGKLDATTGPVKYLTQDLLPHIPSPLTFEEFFKGDWVSSHVICNGGMREDTMNCMEERAGDVP